METQIIEQPKQKSKLQRWKEGMAMITPIQSSKATQKGNWVMLIGFVAGIIVMAFKISQFWWIEVILGAGLFNHVIMMLGMQQKINMLSKLEQEDTNESITEQESSI